MGIATGRHALVTGASRGIGRALAEMLAQEGARVSILARDSHLLAEAAAALHTYDVKAEWFVCDVTDAAALTEATSAAERALGPIDILVNNAGLTERHDIARFPLQVFDHILAVNLRAPLVAAQAVLPGMMARGWGRIVNITSIYAERPAPRMAAYSTAKAGLAMLTRCIALEAAGTGVTANAIAPVQILTEQSRPAFQDPARKAVIDSQIPIGRWAEVEDLRGALLYLVSQGSAMTTGQTINVDGGRLLL